MKIRNIQFFFLHFPNNLVSLREFEGKTMKPVFILFITLVLSVFCTPLAAQKNYSPVPFDSLLHKTYAQNRADIGILYEYVMPMNSAAALSFIDSFRHFAVRHKEKTLELEMDFFETSYRSWNSIPLPGGDKWNEKSIYTYFQRLARKAEREHVIQTQIRATRLMGWTSWHHLKNYEMAFEYYHRVLQLADLVSDAEYIDKIYDLAEIGGAYIQFKDYPQAISIYKKTLQFEDNSFNDNPLADARNSLGISYRELGVLDSSDYYFKEVLDFKSASRYREWEGIANANLGYNQVLRGNPDEAIPLLQFGLNRALEYNDSNIIISSSVRLADVYLNKGKPAQAAPLLELARKTAAGGDSGYMAQLYHAYSKYYALTGKGKLAVMYADSSLLVKNRYEDKFNSLLLLRMEQKEAAQYHQQKEAELSETRSRMLAFSIGFIIVCILLGVVAFLYRQKRRAYRALVERIQQWAQVTTERTPLFLPEAEVVEADYEEIKTILPEDSTPVQPDKIDWVLFDKLQQLFQEEHLYRNTSITLDEIARRMKVNRAYLSQAVNRCAGKNFNAYINEYRIKEAVRLMSENSSADTLEEIAFETGFNDRRTFYAAFKKMTGLSPSQFRNNLQPQPPKED